MWQRERQVNRRDWSLVLQESHSATPFHTWEYGQVLAEAYGMTPAYEVYTDSRDGVVGFPWVVCRSVLGRRYLSTTPYVGTPCGFVSSKNPSPDSLARMLSSIRMQVQISLPIVPRQQGVYACFTLPLSGGSEQVWSSLKSEMRRDIRKGLRSDLDCRRGGQELLSDFLRVYRKRMRELGSPAHAPAYFDALVKSFPTHIFVTYYQGVPVAALWVLKWGNRVYTPFAASDMQASKLEANKVTYWRAIEWACQQSCSEFDFGRSIQGSPHERFKLRWGCKRDPFDYYSLSRIGAWCAQPGPDRPLIRYGSKGWRLLPVSWADRLGPHIARCFA